MRTTSACLPQHPAVAYLCLVRCRCARSPFLQSLTLAPHHRLDPIIHDAVPDVVTFYDLHGAKIGSISSPKEVLPFGTSIILIDERGVSYTKLSDWTQLPKQERPSFQ
jgi:hypothetical protein